MEDQHIMLAFDQADQRAKEQEQREFMEGLPPEVLEQMGTSTVEILSDASEGNGVDHVLPSEVTLEEERRTMALQMERQEREISGLKRQIGTMATQFDAASQNIQQVVQGMGGINETIQRGIQGGIQAAVAQLQQNVVQQVNQAPPTGSPIQGGLAGVPVTSPAPTGAEGVAKTFFDQIKPVIEMITPFVTASQNAQIVQAQAQAQAQAQQPQASPYEALREGLGVIGGLLQAFMGIQTTMYKGMSEMVKVGAMPAYGMVASPPVLQLPAPKKGGKKPVVQLRVPQMRQVEPDDEEEEDPRKTFHVRGV